MRKWRQAAKSSRRVLAGAAIASLLGLLLFWTWVSINVDYASGSGARRARVQSLAGSIYAYSQDMGRLPGTLSDLLSSDEQGWAGPYVRPESLRDIDATEFIYEIVDAEKRRFRLTSPARMGRSLLPAIVEDDVAAQE
jgi:hypothetical protein